MNTTKPRNKRTVPIRFNEDESHKYKSSSKKNQRAQFRRQDHNEGDGNNDSQQRSDRNLGNEESSQEYIRSSYINTESERRLRNKPMADGQVYPEEEFEDMYGQSGSSHKLPGMKHTNNPYELTFKKQMPNNQLFVYEDSYNVPSNSHSNNFQDSSQSFEQIPFAQQQSKPVHNYHPNNPQSLAEARQQLFQKYFNSLIHVQYYRSRTTKDIEEKHKENLYCLLATQLPKNIFINGLKLHLLKNKHKNKRKLTLSQKSLQNPLSFNSRPQNPQITSQILNQSLLDQLQPKLVIFEQITYGIIKRRIFECFSLIVSKSQILPKHLSDEQQDNLSHNSSNNDNSQLNSSQQESQYNQAINQKQVAPSSQPIRKLSRPRPKQQSPYNKYQVSQSRQSQPFHKSSSQSHNKSSSQTRQQNNPKNISNQISQYEQDYEDGIQSEEGLNQEEEKSEELQRMRELIQYIESLKKQARQTDSQLSRYFIKWKIYMLEAILEDYGRGQQQSQFNEQDQSDYSAEENMQENMQENDYELHTQQNDQNDLEQPLNIFHNPVRTPVQSLTQRQSENPSSQKHKKPFHNSHNHSLQNQDEIKQKKLILKSFLYQNRLNQFWTSFNDHFTNQKLILATGKVRQQQLKKKVLAALRINIDFNQKQKAIDFYFQEIAQDQDQSQYRTADLNYRTNLKAKFFFELVKTCRNLKWIRKLDKLTLKFAFWKISILSQAKKRKDQNIQRHFLLLRTKAIFKSFQAWKESTILSPHYQRLKIFHENKNQQILEHYFSVLQILHKQALIKHKKAANHFKSKQLAKVFDYFKFLSKQSRQIMKKQQSLTEYLMFSRGNKFIQRFYEFYGERILDHRLNIKAQKLWLSRQKQEMYERLQQWRNFVIKKQSYRAIEYRLVKLREKETKGRIMEVWVNELDKRMNKKDELEQSAQHKDWLVKYYGSLCEIATSGKQMGNK